MQKRRHRGLESSRKLDRLLQALRSSEEGQTIDSLAERTGHSERTIRRHLAVLEEQFLVDSEFVGRRKLWRAVWRRDRGKADLSGMISLLVARLLMSTFRGTGLSDYLEEVFSNLRAAADQRTISSLRVLEKKLLFVDHAAHDFDDREDDFDEMISALLQEVPVQVRHVTVASGERSFRLNPYALLIYKNGIYVLGHSEHHSGIRTFGFDGFGSISRLRQDRFTVPDEFDPWAYVGGGFGLIGGPSSEVRLRFDRRVARFVRRRRWHTSQQLVDHDGALEMRLAVKGTAELISWILSFGSKVEVLSPPSLRAKVHEELLRAAKRNAPA